MAEVEWRLVVVGGGIAGLAAAHRAAERGDPGRVALVEASPRLGGKIVSERVEGYLVEGGPDSFLSSKPAGVELARALGIDSRLQQTDPRYRRSYVKRSGRLHRLPEGLTGLVPTRVGPLLTSSLLSLRGRLRAGLEPWVPARRDGADESIADFVTRRFGREAYHWLVEPLLSGVYAGDGAALSLEATFPHLLEMERTQRSVLKAMLRRRNGGAGFLAPAGGMEELVKALERSLGGVTQLRGVAARTVARSEGGYLVRLSDGRALATPALILATPAYVAADLVTALDPTLAAVLREIPFVSTTTVSAGFPRAAVSRPFPGTGYVSPRAEGSSVVACTWTSNKFAGRAPGQDVLVRFFVGRAGREELAAASEDEIKAVLRRELRDVLGLQREPLFWKLFRWPRGLPQYVVGHGERLRRIEGRVASLPGLALAGCSYRGVGIPDCIASGRAAMEAVW